MDLSLDKQDRLTMDVEISIEKVHHIANSVDKKSTLQDAATPSKHSVRKQYNLESNKDDNANIDDALIQNDSNTQNLNSLPDTNNDDFVDALDTVMHNTIQNNNNGSIGENTQHNNSDDIDATTATNDNKVNPEKTDSAIKKEPGFWNGMKFYINQDKQAYDHINDINQLISLIKENDGILLKKWPQGKDIEDGIIVSPYNYTGHVTVSPTYIKACTQVNKRIDYHNYLVPHDKTKDDDNTKKDGNNKKNQTRNLGDNNDDDGNSSDDSFHAVHQPPLDLTGLNKNISSSNEGKKQISSNMESLLDLSSKTKEKDKNSGSSYNSDANTEKATGSDGNDKETNRSQDETHRAMGRNYSSFSNSKTSFTLDEDAFILDVVRKNPTRRNTHSLYDEISNYIPNHTGNSIRHRYRIYLSKSLDFVYKVDNMGKLLRDESGNLIKTKDLPPILKKKFTAVEDYSLAMQVKKQFYKDLYKVDPITGQSTLLSHLQLDDNSPLNITQQTKKNLELLKGIAARGNEPKFDDFKVGDRRGPLAREFFKEMAELYPDHTESAWRDRFRKFLLQYGIDNYITYYETEIANNRVPEPMKNLTNRKRSGPSPGNNNIATKRLKAAVSQKIVEATMADSPKSSGNSTAEHNGDDNTNANDVINDNRTVIEINAEDKLTLKNVETSTQTKENISKGELINTENISKKTRIKESKMKSAHNDNIGNKEIFDGSEELLDEETYRFISSLKKNFETNENIDTDWILSTGYFNTHNQDNEDPSTPKHSSGDSDNSENLAGNSNGSSDEHNINNKDGFMDDVNESDTGRLEYSNELADAVRTDYDLEKEEGYDDMNFDSIMWPPSIASAELFSPRFYEMNTPKEFIEKITEIVNREFEPSQAEKLVQIMWEELGVRKTFSTAILTSLSGDLMVLPRYFLTMFKKNENPPRNVPGIWTREDDDKLRGGDPRDIEELKLKHGSNRIQMRAKFISNNII